MKKFITITLVSILTFACAIPVCAETPAFIGETKPSIVGNFVKQPVETEPLSEEEYRDLYPGRYRAEHECEGCREVNKIKEKEYDQMLFGSWYTWSMPSWWYLYGDFDE